MGNTPHDRTEPQPRAALDARLSETCDAAESVPAQPANGERQSASSATPATPRPGLVQVRRRGAGSTLPAST
jgi:hypothetical protein